jgi:uncharacterized protein
MSAQELPLFPLNTVLFPGGVLPLRIFEPRYLDMVSRCMKAGSGFAVMTIEDGQEAGQPAHFHPLGTLAYIVDFDRLDDGTLGITCRGGERVEVRNHRVDGNRLIIGTVHPLAAEEASRIDQRHTPLIHFLRELLARDEVEVYRRWLDEDWTSTRWLGFRLAELLPLPLPVKYQLLELRDAQQRLDILETILRDNRLL